MIKGDEGKSAHPPIDPNRTVKREEIADIFQGNPMTLDSITTTKAGATGYVRGIGTD